MIEADNRDGLQRLTKMGAIEPGLRPETVTCKACDGDHPAVIEYDSTRRCYFHFCQEVRFVTIEDADLITYRFRPDWLPEWLAAALPIESPVHRPPLVSEHIWHLGDATCGDTLVTVIVARRVSGLTALDRLASVVRPIHRADRGVVITTSLHASRQVPLPGGYEFLPFPEIVRDDSEGLMLDHVRLGSWIRGMYATTAKGASTRAGRPSQEAAIRRIYNSRRGRSLTLDNDSAEARAILDAWSQHAPDQEQPSPSTVRGHVARLRKANGPT